MSDTLPLSALLSQTLVAFIVEFDNEFEHRMSHRTTNHGSTGGARHGPWLVSMVMWWRFLRHVPDEGIPGRELQKRLCLPRKEMQIWATRMGKWWRYVTLDANGIVRFTAAGGKANAVWGSLVGEIEERWERRFGARTIDELRQALEGIVSRLDADLPDCLPIVGYGLFSKVSACPTAVNSALPALLSKALLRFVVDFESESEVSLAISANVLRLFGKESSVRVRDLPRQAGVSKEAISMALGYLEKRGFGKVGPEAAGSRYKAFQLSEPGRRELHAYGEKVRGIEERWRTEFGMDQFGRLRLALEQLGGEAAFLEGLEPYPEGWRAAVARPERLPHYPMILHRGGFPDGS